MSALDKAPDVIGPNERLRPLRDQIILEPLEFEPSKIIECVRFGRPVRGIVKAVGPGRYLTRRFKTADGKRWIRDTNAFVPTSVKVGETVELGGLNAFDGEGLKFDEIILDGKKHLVICERDVCFVS